MNNKFNKWLFVLVVGLALVSLSYIFMLRFFLSPPQKQDCSHDLIYLSSIINAEADTTDKNDMFLVGSTILNRRDSGKFESQIDSVITSKSQYVGFKTNRFERSVTTDSIAAKLLRRIGRDSQVFYFVNPNTITDGAFKKQLKQKDIVGRSNNHIFFGR